mmetsp:Transcript_1626/g.3517  ORF Transcript_1626/g.3517 Transcript_1626/m.3517 type:complete len:217 (-) Transcript_1626:125-775(-)
MFLPVFPGAFVFERARNSAAAAKPAILFCKRILMVLLFIFVDDDDVIWIRNSCSRSNSRSDCPYPSDGGVSAVHPNRPRQNRPPLLFRAAASAGCWLFECRMGAAPFPFPLRAAASVEMPLGRSPLLPWVGKITKRQSWQRLLFRVSPRPSRRWPDSPNSSSSPLAVLVRRSQTIAAERPWPLPAPIWGIVVSFVVGKHRRWKTAAAGFEPAGHSR